MRFTKQRKYKRNIECTDFTNITKKIELPQLPYKRHVEFIYQLKNSFGGEAKD
jgi:hypothetical protein